MYKIGVIGDRDSVLGFMAVGFSVFTANSAEEAHKYIVQLAKSEFAIIYITEDLAAQNEELIAKFKDMPLPAIITIPGKSGSTGYGLANIRRSVERAVGADILFND